MARRTHYSASSLAEATRGRRLPSRAVVEAFATACDADTADWVAKWKAVLREPPETAPETALETAPETVSGQAPEKGSFPLRRYLVPVAGAAVAAAVGLGAGMAVGRHDATATPATLKAPSPAAVYTAVPSSAPKGANAVDGNDPVVAHCTGDARLVDKSPVLADGVQIGALELKYSPFCGAGWVRLYLYPAQPIMFGKATVAAADGRSVTFANPLVKSVPIWTDVIVPSEANCLSAQAVIYATGKPPATATMPCQAMPTAPSLTPATSRPT